ncbi:CdaR family protein [Clostridium sp. BJN0001]|uniref:CdaR family protein n=1 Tax=Clostridium sp. BJN0001 TaxID=2930219 RepID=UPI001FD004BE|nr:CdaR family protein [Clostridium sp. BJN0001]
MDKDEKISKSIIVKLICLLISTCLWFYVSNVENPTRTSKIKNVPVQLINLSSLQDAGLAISENQDFTVDLSLEGSSKNVINAKVEDFKVEADMSAYALKEGENLIPIKIVDYPENVSIKNNGVLAVKVKLEKMIQKDIDLVSKVDISYKDNIYEKDKKISPSKVTISGPQSAVDRVTQAVIEGEEKNVDRNMEASYDIQFIDQKGNKVSNIDSNYNKAQLEIEVSSGKSVPVTVKTQSNIKEGYILESALPSSESVVIIGNTDNLNNISEIETEPIDLSEITGDTEISAKLKLPNNITLFNGEDKIKVEIKVVAAKNPTSVMSVKVNCNNLKDEFAIKNENIVTSVTFSGNTEDLKSLTAKDIEASVDLSQISEEGTYNFKPSVTTKKNIEVSAVSEVSITINKK